MSLRPRPIDYNESWEEFRSDLNKIYSFSGLDHVSGMNLFQLVYYFCNARPTGYHERLFNSIADYLTDYADAVRRKILSHEEIVPVYAEEWKKYCVASSVVDSFCAYLNRSITKLKDPYGGVLDRKATVGGGKYRKQTIEALAYLIWKNFVVLKIKQQCHNRFIYQVLQIVQADRDGEEVPYDLVRAAVESLGRLNSHTEQPLHLYIEEYEKPYIAATESYYYREAADVMASESISDYMAKAILRLQQEVVRNRRYCDPSSHEKVIKACETQYIAVHQASIHECFESLVAEERYNDCTMAYNLLSRIDDGVNPLLDVFEKHISRLGISIVGRLGQSVAKDPREYVEPLMDLHNKYTSIAARVFNGDPAFVAALDKAFRAIVNDIAINPHAQSPELLAKYCDAMLKKNTKISITEAEADEKLNRLIILFTYIDDKDVFQKFYSRLLAKRLIYSASLSEEAEAGMISRLKGTCGVEYTSKLQRMFTDMAVSNDVNTTFNNANAKSDLSFSILVLTAGAWPLTQVAGSEFQLPEELTRDVTDFTEFYNTHYSGRKLTWLWHLSKGEIKLTYLDKRYELSVSLYQLGVLLLFNTSTKIPYREIRENVRLSDADLKRVFKPLLDLGIFLAPSMDQTWEGDDIFCLNMNFTSKRTKIKVSTAMQADTPQEASSTRKAVDEDRKLYLQAAIVRVMKSRQEFSHTHLVQEVIDQAKSRFAPSVGMIKKCIEQLLEKSYIERSKDVRDKYLYIA